MPDYEREQIEQILGKPASAGIFVSPSIGMSLRTTNNSYLELKAGYSIAPNILGKEYEGEFDIHGRNYYKASCQSVKMSAPFVTLGYTHTFRWGSKWGK